VDLPELPQPFWRREALAAGLTRHELAGLARRGRLVRLHPGLYAVALAWEATSPWDRHQSLAHAAARGVPGCVASHVSAASLWGLPTPWRPPRLAHLTLFGGPSTTSNAVRTSRNHDWFRLHRGALGSAQVTEHRGIRLTTPARTVVDSLRQLWLPDGVAIGDAALRRGIAQVSELRTERLAQRRWQHVTRVDAALPLLDPRRENWLESASAVLLHSVGVPLALPQVEVFDEWGNFLARVDAYWPEAGVVGEADGRGKYLDAAAAGDRPEREVAARLVAAAARESRLRDTGLEVFRWEPREVVRTPEVVARRYHSACRRGDPLRVQAVLRCSCCRAPLTQCAVDRVLLPIRRSAAA
jgi:predicted transcriptional regulator of viral defense system